MESEAAAAERGATDKALAGLLFQGGLRRSEAAALRWADVQDAADGRGIVVYVRRSKTDQDGTAADVRYLKNGCAAALRQLRDRLTVQRSGLRPDGTAPGARRHQRPVHRAAPHRRGQRRRHRGANHRALRTCRPRRRIDQAPAHRSRQRQRRAGGSRHGWSPTTRRPSQPSRAPSLPTCRRVECRGGNNRQSLLWHRHLCRHRHSGNPQALDGLMI